MPHEVDITVGKQIRAFRHLQGVTQEQLATQVGCKFQQVQKYETGANRVSASRLVMIARALDVSIIDLFENASDSSEKPNILPNRHELRHLHDLRQLTKVQREAFYALVHAIK